MKSPQEGPSWLQFAIHNFLSLLFYSDSSVTAEAKNGGYITVAHRSGHHQWLARTLTLLLRVDVCPETATFHLNTLSLTLPSGLALAIPLPGKLFLHVFMWLTPSGARVSAHYVSLNMLPKVIIIP